MDIPRTYLGNINQVFYAHGALVLNMDAAGQEPHVVLNEIGCCEALDAESFA